MRSACKREKDKKNHLFNWLNKSSSGSSCATVTKIEHCTLFNRMTTDEKKSALLIGFRGNNDKKLSVTIKTAIMSINLFIF